MRGSSDNLRVLAMQATKRFERASALAAALHAVMQQM